MSKEVKVMNLQDIKRVRVEIPIKGSIVFSQSDFEYPKAGKENEPNFWNGALLLMYQQWIESNPATAVQKLKELQAQWKDNYAASETDDERRVFAFLTEAVAIAHRLYTTGHRSTYEPSAVELAQEGYYRAKEVAGKWLDVAGVQLGRTRDYLATHRAGRVKVHIADVISKDYTPVPKDDTFDDLMSGAVKKPDHAAQVTAVMEKASLPAHPIAVPEGCDEM